MDKNAPFTKHIYNRMNKTYERLLHRISGWENIKMSLAESLLFHLWQIIMIYHKSCSRLVYNLYLFSNEYTTQTKNI
jgi:hypothetical protein